ncbi:tRNA (adenosine(37)-N6)-threonylcarbamoyltransferase complex dimerization subunit type 1 TsaB [Gemmatimonas sp.]
MLPLSFSDPLLAVEASTIAGSVALWREGTLVGAESVPMGAGRADQLFPAMQRLLAVAELHPRQLKGLVCGAGPGSFTSLRIAASLAKGLAHGARCPLYAVPSLLLAAAAAKDVPPGPYVLHADALRFERYAQAVVQRPDGVWEVAGPLARMANESLRIDALPARRIAVLASPFADELHVATPDIALLTRLAGTWRDAPVPLESWEPTYGRLAEAQVKWEERAGLPLPETPAVRS